MRARQSDHTEAFERTFAVIFSGTILQIIRRENFIAMKCFANGLQAQFSTIAPLPES